MKKWTQEEINFIKNNTNKTSKEISELLGRNRECVREKCRQNKIILKKDFNGIANTIEKERIRRQKLSDIIKQRYDNGWKPVCGRAKKYNYKYKNDANIISIDGTWELKFCIFLDNNNLKWERNTKSFKYFNLSGKTSNYTPDFYVYDWNSYIEIKGYKTLLDECKWNQFENNLLIYDKNKLQKLNILNIDISEYKIPIKYKYKCKKCEKELKRIYKTGLCSKCYIETKQIKEL